VFLFARKGSPTNAEAALVIFEPGKRVE